MERFFFHRHPKLLSSKTTQGGCFGELLYICCRTYRLELTKMSKRVKRKNKTTKTKQKTQSNIKWQCRRKRPCVVVIGGLEGIFSRQIVEQLSCNIIKDFRT